MVDGPSLGNRCGVFAGDHQHCAACSCSSGKTFCRLTINRNLNSTCARPKAIPWRPLLRLAERISADVRKLPGVTDTLTTIGGGQQQQVNVATIYVKMQPLEERERQPKRPDGSGARRNSGEIFERVSRPTSDQRAASGGNFRRRFPQCGSSVCYRRAGSGEADCNTPKRCWKR